MTNPTFGLLPDDVDIPPSEATVAFFNTLRTLELIDLGHVYALDADEAKTTIGRQFARGRVALIRQILQERGGL